MFNNFKKAQTIDYTQEMNLSRALAPLRGLFPSWRFFESFGQVPQLFVRLAKSGAEFGEWEPCLLKSDRNWYSLFLNPKGNLILALNSLLEELVSDINDSDLNESAKIANSVSYALVKNYAEYFIRQQKYGNGIQRFQFKVASVLSGISNDPIEEALVSALHEFS